MPLFVAFQKHSSLENALEKAPPLLIILAMSGIMLLDVSSEAAAAVVIVGLSGILIASLKEGAFAYKCSSDNRIVYVGLISYSLYLWHWGR